MKDDASLNRYLGILAARNPALHSLLVASNEEQFVEAVEGCLEQSFSSIEGGLKQYVALDERGLSKLLSDLLIAAGFEASAETYHNGHVDVVISCAWGRGWRALVECKLHRGYQYHVDGCEQVLRYCTGRQRQVFTVDFFKVPSMYSKMKGLRQKFDEHRPLEQTGEGRERDYRGSFATPHLHKSGAEVTLVHYGVNLCQ